MAFNTSGLFGPNIAMTLAGVTGCFKIGAGSYGGSAQSSVVDSFKIALFGNGVTPAYYDTIAHNCYNGAAGTWLTTNEVTSTIGNWPAGGVALAGITLSASASPINWTATAVNVASTSIAGIYGCLIYDTTATLNSTVTNPALLCIAFAGAPYSTSSGTFGITWSGSGIWTWAGPNSGP